MARFVVASVALTTLLCGTPAHQPSDGDAVARAGTTPKPVGAPGEWRLVWHDEFRGARLNLSKWRPNWLAGDDRTITKPVNDLEVAAYDPGQVSVRYGVLRLRAAKRTVTASD